MLSPAEMEKVAYYFRLLGEPMRLKILQCVSRTPRTVMEIVEKTGASETNISKYLALPAVGGLFRGPRCGRLRIKIGGVR